MRILTTFLLFYAPSLIFSQILVVKPYLQDAEPHSIRIAWETSTGEESTVRWGLTPDLGQTASGTAIVGSGISKIHHVQIADLNPNTRYYYQVQTGGAVSEIYDFITPPMANSEPNFNIVAMSDMQRDPAHTGVFKDICDNGVIGYMQSIGLNDLAGHLAFVMIPGDLVDYGPDYQQWANTFFTPSENLFSHLPVYPVLGNHEANSPNYFKYFYLPENGSPGYLEHWWYKDYANLRIIGLNSNTGYTIAEQLVWLDDVLEDACGNTDIDFVFAQLHHPHHSELWVAGNLDYTGEVIDRLENFSTLCGKPSIHFYGHTHGYSRGQSQRHQHLMVNVASAGGNIDHWDEYAQNDYPEHSVSQDEYGFVWVELTSGAQPQFLLRRISRGDENVTLNNVIRDSIVVKRYNLSPATPQGISPAFGQIIQSGCPIVLDADAYFDPEGDLHGASQWQIAREPDFADLVMDQWKQHENWYREVDTQAGDDLTDEQATGLEGNQTYYWRVRYRDRSLSWSEWSAPIMFQTIGSSASGNLLLNPGAEDGVSNWTVVTGGFESIAGGECAGNQAHSGERLFAVGGICVEYAYGEVYQDIDLSSYATAIAGGKAKARFGGYLSDYQGTDYPHFRLEFLTAGLDSILSSPTYGAHTNSWSYFNETADIPANCAILRMTLMGTRENGVDNDSYFDDMFVAVDTSDCDQSSGYSNLNDANQKAELHISPNPAAHEFVVTVLPYFSRSLYQIYDIYGRKVKSGRLSGQTQTKLQVPELQPGVYLIQVNGIKRSKTLIKI